MTGNNKMSLSVRAGLLASVAMLATGSAVYAQSAGSDTTLAPIVIQGQGETATGPVKGYVAKKSATGSKTDTELKDIPQSVSVVGREEMSDRGVTDKVDEALRYTPGVFAEPFGSDPDTDWVYIRGFDATQTGIFYDGLNLFSYGFGGFQVDPFMLERVDVLKGPASVLYGGGNAGGIVDMVRKRPTDEPYYYTEAGINTEGNGYGAFDISDKLGNSDTMSYRLTAKIGGGEGYSDYQNDFRGFIMPQLTISPDEATKVTLWGSYSGLDQRHTGNGFFPYYGTVKDAPGFGKIDRDSFYGEPSTDVGRSNQTMLGYEVEHEFEDGLKFTSNARYGNLYKHENAPYVYGWYNSGGAYAPGSEPGTSPLDPTGDDYLLNRLGFNQTSKVNSFSIDNRLEGKADTGPVSHDVMVGIDYKYYQLDNLQASSPTNPISALDPAYGTAQGANSVYSNQLITQNQLGIYAQDQMRFGNGWLLTLNGRYDHVHTDTDNRETAYGTSPDFSFNNDAWSGRAGLAYEFDNGLTPYVSVGSFFNPRIATGQTSATKPEEGEQYEVGVKYDPTFIDGTFTASLFNLDRRNVYYSVFDSSVGAYVDTQVGEVRSRGLELEGKVNLDSNWKVLGSFTYTDLDTRKDAVAAYVGKKPYLVPDTTASLWLDYSVTDGALEGVSLGAGVRYQGDSYADRLNTLKVPSATVFDAAIRYKRDGWEGSINVNNVFDKEYVKGCGGEFACGYGDPRTIMLKISKTW